MAIPDGSFPVEGLTRGTHSLVNVADHIQPTPLADNETLEATNAEAIGLTALKYADATGAHISVETAPIRFWVNGEDPTATEGFYVNLGGYIKLNSPSEISGFKAIGTSVATATLQVSYWG